MLRNRFTQLGLLLLLSAVTTAVIAGPPPGKGGGGGGDDGGGDPPASLPFTYLLTIEEDFEVQISNDDGDMVGYVPNADGSSSSLALVYDGQRNPLDDFFIGTATTPRVVIAISERDENGGVYICGSCDSVDGVRGFRLQIAPTTGGFSRTAFGILAPADGDTRSVFMDVNSQGEAVGYSDASDGQVESAMLYQSDATGSLTIVDSEVDRGSMRVSELGEVLAITDGVITSWTVAGGLSPLPNVQDIVSIGSSNDFSEFLCDIEVKVTSKKGATSLELVQGFYDGQLSAMEDQYRFQSLNNNLDLFGSYYRSSKGNNPGRTVGEIYIADQDAIFLIDDLIDEANGPDTLSRWFAQEGLYFGNFGSLNSGTLGGDCQLTADFSFADADGLYRRSTFVLTPVWP